MIHLARRHFFNEMNKKHYKKRSKKMGGYIGLESDKSEYIRGEFTPQHVIQDSIDSLNRTIERLDVIIREMDEKCKH